MVYYVPLFQLKQRWKIEAFQNVFLYTQLFLPIKYLKKFYTCLVFWDRLNLCRSVKYVVMNDRGSCVRLLAHSKKEA